VALRCQYQFPRKKTFCDNWTWFHWLYAIPITHPTVQMNFFPVPAHPGCRGLKGYCCATIEPLHQVQNVAARLVLNLHLCDYVTPALKQLHWLPVASRIKLKLCLLMHLIHTGQAPQYLLDCVQPLTIGHIRHLRSSETADYVKQTTRTKFGERGCSCSGPAAWNGILPQLRTISNTNTFKRHLKSFLFIDSFS